MSRNQESIPLVSVVIPTYERPEYLEGAIETVLGQTYGNLEIIVVDDGSKDLYAEEVVSPGVEFVKLVRHKKNQGLSTARNTGIKNSSGKYVAFLDDDDRWHETKLARQVEALEHDNSAGLATCLVVTISTDNDIINCETSVLSGDCSTELLIGNKIGTPSSVLVRKEAIDDVGMFDESLPTKQDWDFYIRLCQQWRVAGVEEHLCFWTYHYSMSSSPEYSKRDNMAILQKHESRIRENQLWDQAQAEVAERIGRAYLKKGDFMAARTHLKKSVSLFPTNRRRILFLLSFTHPTVVTNIINLKRRVVSKKSGCQQGQVNPNRIPGLTK